MRHDTDILIAGGGLAGATLALALARVVPELRVTVVEAYPLAADAVASDYQPSYDARSTALAWGSRQIYDHLGLWANLAEQATPIERIHVSDRGRFGAARMAAAEHGQPALGYVVDNRWMGLCLMQAVRQCPQVQWRAPGRVESVEPLESGVSVQLSEGETQSSLTAQCLVVADGGRSGLREKLGFQARHTHYAQNALIANVSIERRHEFTAYERFTDAGPMALLPVGGPEAAGDRASLVWTLDDTALDNLLGASETQQLQSLQARFGWRLGRFTRLGACQHYPLSLTTVEESIRPGVVLVGNAAHTLHPVAGQGFNLALRGLMALVEQFRRAQAEGQPLGALKVLRAYQQEHERDRRQTAQFSDSLIQLFGSRSAAVAGVRDLGLAGLDLLPGAKRWFARRAMGLGGRRPPVATDQPETGQ